MSEVILAIDPGTTQSGWVKLAVPVITPGLSTPNPLAFGVSPNEEVLDLCRESTLWGIDGLVIEWFEERGMPLGDQHLMTALWVGRFIEAARRPHTLITRRQEKLHTCGSISATDANIRQAMIDRYSGGMGKSVAVGLKKSPGPLYGFKTHIWPALALALTYADGAK